MPHEAILIVEDANNLTEEERDILGQMESIGLEVSTFDDGEDVEVDDDVDDLNSWEDE